MCEWISTVSSFANPFQNATKTEINKSATKGLRYTDIMYNYKKGTVRTKQKTFINKEIDINEIRKQYAKLQRLEQIKLS